MELALRKTVTKTFQHHMVQRNDEQSRLLLEAPCTMHHPTIEQSVWTTFYKDIKRPSNCRQKKLNSTIVRGCVDTLTVRILIRDTYKAQYVL